MSVTDDQLDHDLMIARRAFPVAQELLAGPVLRTESESAAVGWHDTGVSPETGSIALVPEDGDLVDLVGHLVRVDRHLAGSTRTVYAYVYGTAAIADDLSLSRRCFLGLGILANETLECEIGVLA